MTTPAENIYRLQTEKLHKLRIIGTRYHPRVLHAFHPGIELGFTLAPKGAGEYGKELDADVQVSFTGFTCLGVDPKVIVGMNSLEDASVPVASHSLIGMGFLSVSKGLFGVGEGEQMKHGAHLGLKSEDIEELAIFLSLNLRQQFSLDMGMRLAVEFDKSGCFADAYGGSFHYMLSMSVPESTWMAALQLKQEEVAAGVAFKTLADMKYMKSAPSGPKH